jgi:hypothetical protein
MVLGIMRYVANDPMMLVSAPIAMLKNMVQAVAKKIFDAIGAVLNFAVDRALSGLTLGVSDLAKNGVVQQIGGAMFNTATKTPIVGGAIGAAGKAATGGWNPLGWLSGLFGGNKAGGWMPPGSPIAREMAAMPGGARPVVANSSEAILNQGQQSAVAGLMRGNRGGGTFAPVITIQGNADRGDIDYLLGELDRRYRQYSSGFA